MRAWYSVWYGCCGEGDNGSAIANDQDDFRNDYCDFVDKFSGSLEVFGRQISAKSGTQMITDEAFQRQKSCPERVAKASRRTSVRVAQRVLDTDSVDCKQSEKQNVGQMETLELESTRDEEEEEALRTELRSFLEGVQLFKRLPKDELMTLAGAFDRWDFAEGSEVIAQGATGNFFFLIRSGEAAVHKRSDKDSDDPIGVQVATLKVGDYFGENALLRDEPRAATIVATTKLETCRIAREQFQQLGLHAKLQFATRRAVCGGTKVDSACTSGTEREKTPEEAALIASSLRKNANLSVFCALTDKHVKQLADFAWKESVPKGKELIRQGDFDARCFYIVQAGSFDVFIDKARKSSSNERKPVSTISRAGSFGELALLYVAPRAATVQANVDSIVWVIDRQHFKSVLVDGADNLIVQYMQYFDHIDCLQCLIPAERKVLAKALQEFSCVRGDTVLTTGETNSTMYILTRGKVIESIETPVKQDKIYTADPTRGTVHIFAPNALLRDETQSGTVQVASATAEFLVLDRGSLETLLEPLSELVKASETFIGGMRTVPMIRQAKAVLKPKTASKSSKKARKATAQKDLRTIGLMGCGGFGTVELVEHKTSGKTYALKSLSKGHIVKTGMQEGIFLERDVMLLCASPFIIRLYETYNSPQMLHFLMEAALGGELYATYMRKGLYGNANLCRFYAASIMCAFEHMHPRNIIYRDLKPENVLLSETGYMKLADMGLATVAIGKAYTTCGTPDYFAPEMIQSTGHTRAVDWWALGVLMFELLSGCPPFEAETPMGVYTKVMKGIQGVKFPAACDGTVSEVLRGLMKSNAAARLPMRPGGSSNLKALEWFEGFRFDALERGHMDAPYKPRVLDRKDLSNFSCDREDCPPLVKYVNDKSGWDRDFASA
eukprot:TRINITY_DN39574_c0_g1_i1.p1 TRINITY_DN39574_c0_g1~~TRINITY_DN39574_c0_g1_i1.p1  ORF type:complete len:897 (+),score=195.19 TRINITY_DN39574_c0_g1_i1:110-2800(+)